MHRIEATAVGGGLDTIPRRSSVAYALQDFVEVLPFTRQPEGDEVVIGRPETGVFLALPAEAVDILDDLAAGQSVGAAQLSFERAHQETPDVADLLIFLESKGFVRKRDEEPARGYGSTPPPKSSSPASVRYHFANIPEAAAKRVFGPTSTRLYLLTIAAASMILAWDPTLIPDGRSLYFLEHRTAKFLILFLFSVLSIFVHEFCHLLAARAVGVKSRIGIGNRLWILVAETDLTGLWAVPRNQRYLPILAGPISDGVFASLIVFLLHAQAQGHLELSSGMVEIVRACLLLYLVRLLWQFFFFVRTDVYYLITLSFGCKNLMKDTQRFLQNRLLHLFRRPPKEDQSRIPPAEMRVIKAYSVLWLLGRGLAFVSLFLVTFPALSGYIRDLFEALERGSGSDPYGFIDTLVVNMINLVPLALGLSLWLASLLKRSRT
jgi:putative peptide zinc metalloprotease protein